MSQPTATQASTVDVELGERSYRIAIGSGLIGQADTLADIVRGRHALIVTNNVVAPLYAARLKNALSNFNVGVMILPDGEAFKHMALVEAIHTRLLTEGLGRDGVIVALGGGVLGDIAGFAAATYQRGIDYCQVPTTLLAQVDSSVGGKTGVNHVLGKNMIGAFHQPRYVMADLDTLTSLPQREYNAGLAEVVKYGLIRDDAFFEWLASSTDELTRRDQATLAEVIRASCRNKADIVAADEHESGQRALLNLGHTFGHAIETELGYGEWLHGEAVAAGICMAADISARMGLIEPADCRRIEAVFEDLGLPIAPPVKLTCGRLRAAMARDKKTTDGRLNLVVLRAIGDAAVEPADEDMLAETLAHYLD